jgi:hypothetical protein
MASAMVSAKKTLEYALCWDSRAEKDGAEKSRNGDGKDTRWAAGQGKHAHVCERKRSLRNTFFLSPLLMQG